MGKFTDEEIRIAKAVDLVDLAEQIGISLKRKGKFYQAEGMDSVMIFNRSSWCRFSRGVGGSTIDFLEYFKNMNFVESVEYLLAFAGYIRTGERMIPEKKAVCLVRPEERLKKEQKKKDPFVLPPKSQTCRRLYGYLLKERKLSKRIVDFWVRKGLLYESRDYHNLVFVGKDPGGVPRFASQRGTLDKYGKPFKGDVNGNDKTYGINLVDMQCSILNVYEAAIDAMSDMDFREDYQTNILVLGMVSDAPLEKLLENYPHIKRINLCLDNDGPGRLAAKKLARKYTLMGYEVYVGLPPFGKDYNVFLQHERQNRELCRQISKTERNMRSVEENRWEENIAHIKNLCNAEYRRPPQYQMAQAR